LRKLTSKEVQINIVEIRKPEVDAAIVGESIAKQIEARINYRRAIKMAIQSTMRAGGEGIKVRISGRLAGSEMARTEEYKEGRTPLHTFRSDIDYTLAEAYTVYGKIGIKVWICKGEVFGKRDLSPNAGLEKKGAGGDRGEGGRGGEGGGRQNGGRGEGGGRRDGGRRDGSRGEGGGRRDGGRGGRGGGDRRR
jgi:small subunit ribosomal protein S3